MKKLSDLFTVVYGNKFDLNKMRDLPRAAGGVNFVGRSSQNHGVSGTVQMVPNTPPYPAGVITVALGGTKLLCSFVQEHPFYTAQNVAVLRPKSIMTFREKMFVCICIRHNRFRYSAFGREANRTLRDLLIPELEDFPQWVATAASGEEERFAPAVAEPVPLLNTSTWKPHKLNDLFFLKKGKRLTKQQMIPGDTPFIGAIDKNNGLTGFVGQLAIHESNTITVNYNGNGVAEAYFQPVPFWASDDVNVLYPRFQLNAKIAMFLAAIIRREKYRFSYGRKWHLERMEQSEISLPTDSNGEPNWDYMQRVIETLPYSSQL